MVEKPDLKYFKLLKKNRPLKNKINKICFNTNITWGVIALGFKKKERFSFGFLTAT